MRAINCESFKDIVKHCFKLEKFPKSRVYYQPGFGGGMKLPVKGKFSLVKRKNYKLSFCTIYQISIKEEIVLDRRRKPNP